MLIIQYQDCNFNVDDEGFLLDFNTWNEKWAKYSSQAEDIELTEEHWLVINQIQDYYKKNKVPPMARIISRISGFKLKYIYELFPSGPGRGACKIAGLKKTCRLSLIFLIYKLRLLDPLIFIFKS